MATTKTLTPTNQAITLAAFTEKPDNRTNVTNDDKLADAVNALNSNLNSKFAVKTINLTATVGRSSFTPSVCKFGNVVIGSIAIVTTEAVNDLASFITGFPPPRLNPQLPVWEYGNPSCNKRVCILANGEMQPWWNSSPGLPAGNYVIPIYYISEN